MTRPPHPLRRGELLELELDALAFGGAAVGRASDGRVVFVTGGAPGDRAEVCIDEVKANFARATLVRVLAAGPARVAPRCPLVDRCGGCQWQEVVIESQRAAKQEIVARALGRLGAEVMPLVAATPPFGYRSRVRLAVAGGEGQSRELVVRGARSLGFSARRSHEIVDVPACPLLDPALEEAILAVRSVLLPVLLPGATVSALVGREGVHLALAGLGLVSRSRGPVCKAAMKLLGQAHILGVLVEDEVVGVADIDTATGDEPPFFGAADGFAQASATGNQVLRRLVHEAVEALVPPGGRLLELHAGDGNFTRDLVARGEVLAVEGVERATLRLRRNVPRAKVVCAPVEEEVARLLARGARFNAVVLDPPRAGARELLPALARLTERVVYVSCDPMTLGRDAAELAAFGLRPRRAVPVDLMPQTYHVETVCSFAAGAEVRTGT
jgi:23S rRNA (uracil1939-C5)-methyltransferase